LTTKAQRSRAALHSTEVEVDTRLRVAADYRVDQRQTPLHTATEIAHVVRTSERARAATQYET
jgi:hypothetical protein